MLTPDQLEFLLTVLGKVSLRMIAEEKRLYRFQGYCEYDQLPFKDFILFKGIDYSYTEAPPEGEGSILISLNLGKGF